MTYRPPKPIRPSKPKLPFTRETLEQVVKGIVEAARKDNKSRVELWRAFHAAKQSKVPYDTLAMELARHKAVYSKTEISMGATIYGLFIEQEARDPDELEGAGMVNLYLAASYLKRNPEELMNLDDWLERARTMPTTQLRASIKKVNPKEVPTNLKITAGTMANIEAVAIRLQELKLEDDKLPIGMLVEEVFNRLVIMAPKDLAKFWEYSANFLEELQDARAKMRVRHDANPHPVLG